MSTTNETAIFRRLDHPVEEYMEKVEAVMEMDSTDSSLTGTTDRTTITVHRVKAIQEETATIPVEEESNAPPATNTTTLSKEDSPNGSSGHTASTNPVTPDTSIDGGVDPAPSSLLPELPEATPSPVATDDDDKREGVETSESVMAAVVSSPIDEAATKEDGYDSMDSPQRSSIEKDSPTSSFKRSNQNDNDSYSKSRSERSSSRVIRRSSRNQMSHRNLRDDDESSSDDDSSYFATHLPSPKSGRSFSFSSNASNGSAYSSNQFQLHKQGSDASLSFSDESDDEDHHPHLNSSGDVHLSPLINMNRAVVDMNLYPQRITRMHSVSSLVSSASSENNQIGDDSGEDGPNRRRSYTGDDSMTSSIPSVASTGPEMVHNPGYHQSPPPFGYNYYHQQHVATTPPQSYMVQQQPQQPSGMQFYSQQTSLTNQQMMAWSTMPPNDSEFEYTSSECTNSMSKQRSTSAQQPYDQQQQGLLSSTSSNPRNAAGVLKSESTSTLNFVLSEDEDAVGGRSKNNRKSPFSSSTSDMGKQVASDGASARRGSNGHGNSSSGRQQGVDLGRGSSKNPSSGNTINSSSAAVTNGANEGLAVSPGGGEGNRRQTFKVYWRRWLMLFYMSVLNLLSDWTCYSVAPISLLTEEAFGNIDPERLVVVFLGANAIASACEPMLLARLGLRRTVLFGSLLLMIGSIIKSGGVPPFTQTEMVPGHSAEVSLYFGFFIVGLSQPLYQCTPALLSASWFPEEERTMATGVALNANQLGIGFAFIFGTLLVESADDIISYFALLSQISTLCFLGALIQFEDAPPTPPSASARVMKGNLNFKMPDFRRGSAQIQRYFGREQHSAAAPAPASDGKSSSKAKKSPSKREKGKQSARVSSRSNSRRGSSNTRRRNKKSNSAVAAAPSPAQYGSTADAIKAIAISKAEMESIGPLAQAPSPAMDSEGAPQRDEETDAAQGLVPGQMPMGPGGLPGTYPPGQVGYPYGYGGYPPPPPDFHYYQQLQQQQAYYQQHMYQQQLQQAAQGNPPPTQPGPYPPNQQPMPYYPPPPQMVMPYSYQQQYYPPPQYAGLDYRYDDFDYGDEGAEPTLTVTNNHLDIDIRDDQVIRSLHACMIRQGFSHALAAFTVSGIVINTLSTYMDYLVRLNGAPRSYTGIVGGTFQFAIMASSLIMGKQTDKSRAYYSVTTGMLVVGAFGLAECGVSLDSNRGSDLRWSLLVVAVLVGPLQPISTELGVEVAYPLSENTVLVIQQLFSNLLSALFIPFFKSLKDIGTTVVRGNDVIERPEYTFSFYLLIVLHTLVTVYFATFNGRYLRYEHEIQKKEEEAAQDAKEDAEAAEAAQRGGEYAPLIPPQR